MSNFIPISIFLIFVHSKSLAWIKIYYKWPLHIAKLIIIDLTEYVFLSVYNQAIIHPNITYSFLQSTFHHIHYWKCFVMLIVSTGEKFLFNKQINHGLNFVSIYFHQFFSKAINSFQVRKFFSYVHIKYISHADYPTSR